MSKGAFPFTGTSMPKGRGKLTSAQGKMSGAHGCTGQSKDNNMSQNKGSTTVGSGTRTFKKSDYCVAGMGRK